MPYLKQYIILTSILTILSAVVFNVFLPEKLTFAVYLVPIIFAAISLIVLKIMKNPKFGQLTKFSNAFMLTNMAKLFVYLIVFVALYFISGKNTAFAVDFLAVYAVFAVADTAVLLKIFKE
ncbi:MAG: hypothetical protein II956_04760 [Bacteroidales bacterium]|nr:hypothetical protein [Bacteroidales bacterium]